MYVPGYAAVPDPDVSREIARRFPFAVLTTAGSLGLYATHVPLSLVAPDRLVGHLARANPQVADLDGPALAVFSGPHAVVRSDVYRAPTRQVPTWNYVAAHATGVARRLDDPAEVLAVALAEHLPNTVQPDPAFVERLSAGIVAFELRVERWEGKVKLSQNRDAEDRQRVIDAMVERGEHELVAWMRRFG